MTSGSTPSAARITSRACSSTDSDDASSPLCSAGRSMTVAPASAATRRSRRRRWTRRRRQPSSPLGRSARPVPRSGSPPTTCRFLRGIPFEPPRAGMITTTRIAGPGTSAAVVIPIIMAQWHPESVNRSRDERVSNQPSWNPKVGRSLRGPDARARRRLPVRPQSSVGTGDRPRSRADPIRGPVPHRPPGTRARGPHRCGRPLPRQHLRDQARAGAGECAPLAWSPSSGAHAVRPQRPDPAVRHARSGSTTCGRAIG